jgi:hypothetical protein
MCDQDSSQLARMPTTTQCWTLICMRPNTKMVYQESYDQYHHWEWILRKILKVDFLQWSSRSLMTVLSVPALFWMLQGQIHHFVLSIHMRALAWGWICKIRMVYLSWRLSNRAGGCVTSRKVVWVDSTSGGYNLSSITFYSKGFKIVTSLNKAIGHLAPPLWGSPELSNNPHTFQWWLTITRMTSFLRLFVNKVSKFHLFILYIALHLLHLGVACC